jgi:hypothetical protein
MINTETFPRSTRTPAGQPRHARGAHKRAQLKLLKNSVQKEPVSGVENRKTRKWGISYTMYQCPHDQAVVACEKKFVNSDIVDRGGYIITANAAYRLRLVERELVAENGSSQSFM